MEIPPMNTASRSTSVLLLALALSLTVLVGVARAGDDPDGDKPTPAQPDSPNIATIVLTASGITSTSSTAWSVTNNGTGRAGYFFLNNASSTNPALEGRSNSRAANAAGLLGVMVPAAGG